MADSLYAHWAKLKQWSLHDAISIFADYEVMHAGIVDAHYFYTLRDSIYKRQAGSFRRFFRENPDKLTKVAYLEETWDSEEDQEADNPSIDFKASFAKSADIINWAVISGLKVPNEFVMLNNEQPADDEELTDDISAESATDQDVENVDSPLTPDERRKYNQLKLLKDTMNMSIMAAVHSGLFYATLKDGEIFDKGILYEKLREWKFGAITKKSIDLIYQSLPPTHKRKPGEKKTKK